MVGKETNVGPVSDASAVVTGIVEGGPVVDGEAVPAEAADANVEVPVPEKSSSNPVQQPNYYYRKSDNQLIYPNDPSLAKNDDYIPVVVEVPGDKDDANYSEYMGAVVRSLTDEKLPHEAYAGPGK